MYRGAFLDYNRLNTFLHEYCSRVQYTTQDAKSNDEEILLGIAN